MFAQRHHLALQRHVTGIVTYCKDIQCLQSLLDVPRKYDQLGRLLECWANFTRLDNLVGQRNTKNVVEVAFVFVTTS